VFDVGSDAFTLNFTAKQKRYEGNCTYGATSYKNPKTMTLWRSTLALFRHYVPCLQPQPTSTPQRSAPRRSGWLSLQPQAISMTFVPRSSFARLLLAIQAAPTLMEEAQA
jgi:hypothetical protein